jgi:proteasome lid subunit RPN8/RPN11
MGELQLAIEVRRGRLLLGSAPVSLGFLREDILFDGILSGRLPNDGAAPEFVITPHWSDGDPPTIASLSLSTEGAPGATYDRTVYAPQARSLIRQLLRDGVLRDGESVEWSLVAAPTPPRRFSVRACRSPFPLQASPLPDVPRGELRVEVEGSLLRRLRERIVRHGAVEHAGLLLGELLHDAERGAGKLRVIDTLEVHAGSSGASRLHFGFDPDSFVSAMKEAERHTEASICGWWHSHPPCEACPDRPDCPAQTVFFSSDDIEVHRSAFGAPYHLALVAGKLRDLPATRPGFRLYGWRQGQVVDRPFQVTNHEERWEPAGLPPGGCS